MEISFEVLNDNIFEGTEIGEFSIARDPLNFDGYTPFFGSVRIVINDSDGKMNHIDLNTLIVEDPSL